MELDDAVHQAVVKLSEEGDALADDSKYAQALLKYHEAIQLLPKPIENWNATLWLYAAIGDAYFFMHNYDEAFEWFKKCIIFVGGIGNPFIHMRLGQCSYEMGDKTFSRDELIRAFMAGGTEVFSEQDRKYLDSIQDLIDPGQRN